MRAPERPATLQVVVMGRRGWVLASGLWRMHLVLHVPMRLLSCFRFLGFGVLAGLAPKLEKQEGRPPALRRRSQGAPAPSLIFMCACSQRLQSWSDLACPQPGNV